MIAWVLWIGTLAASAQNLEFEVATMRPAGPGGRGVIRGINGGPGTPNPESMRFAGISLRQLMARAHGVGVDQIDGPAWIDADRYDIQAKIAPGSTMAQTNGMLLALLTDRLRVKTHREPRPLPVYEVCIAPGGSKLTPAAFPEAPLVDSAALKVGPDREVYPQLPSNSSGMTGLVTNGLQRLVFSSAPLELFTRQLGVELGEANDISITPAHVVDRTGLTGRYDFRLEYSVSSGIAGRIGRNTDIGGGPDLLRAIEQQLGLRVERVRREFEVIVIDSADRAPAEN